MTELLTAAQMRSIEQAAIESGEVTGLELMERAGRGVVEAVFDEWPELAQTSHRAVVLCGPGNNGGDGFVVARLLKEWGWEVEVFLYGDPAKLPPDARVNYERWVEMGEVHDAAEIEDEDQLIELQSELFVDALFGTGLTRPIELSSKVLGPFFDFADRWQYDTSPSRTVSVDLPSGICSDSGRQLGGCMISALTVTFHSAKVGHFLQATYQGQDGNFIPSAKLRTVDIGLPGQHRLKLVERIRKTLPKGQRHTVWVTRPQTGMLGKHSGRHKYSHGHALILSGGSGKTGAARLAARAALRIGAGLVTLGVPGSAQMEVASQVTSIMLRRAGKPDEVAGVLEDDRINALCLGPGLGVDRARALVEVVLRAGRAAVLDADALTAFEGEPEALFSLCRESRCVLTPHGGEFKRLFPDIAEKLEAPATKGPAYSKVDATREAAARAGCVVLFKGPDTVIAAPDGRCSINSAHYERSAPWLATAGSGDVLAGFITGLLARGFDPMQAAESAAWLHVECALSFGPGLIAEDIPDELPKVFRQLGI